MDHNKRASATSTILIALVAFLAGAVIGLVVLGWGVWPVTWEGGSVNILDPGAQTDFLSAAIDSYSYNSDAQLARARYESLGENRQAILRAIYTAPAEITKQEVENFSSAVGATDVLTAQAPIAPPTSPQTSSVYSWLVTRPLWLIFCLIGLAALLVLILVLLLILRGRSRRRRLSQEKPAVITFDTPPEQDQSQADYPLPQSSDLSRISNQDRSTISVETPAMPGHTQSGMGESQLPDWLQAPSDAELAVQNEPEDRSKTVELSAEDVAAIAGSGFSFPPEAETSQLLDEIPPKGSGPEIASRELDSNLASTIISESERETIKWPTTPAPAEETPSSPDSEEVFEQAFRPDMSGATPSEISEETPVASGETPSETTEKETPEQTLAKFSVDILSIPGLDETSAGALRRAGIAAPLLLLRNGSTAQDRANLAFQTGIEESKILGWVAYVDLLRIKGLNLQDAEMLKAAGVDMIVELATRDPVNLSEKIEAVAGNLDPDYDLPPLSRIRDWIDQATWLPRIVTY
jgi:hypothetical protein